MVGSRRSINGSSSLMVRLRFVAYFDVTTFVDNISDILWPPTDSIFQRFLLILGFFRFDCILHYQLGTSVLTSDNDCSVLVE
jgi:hypothetical protein